MELDEPDHMLLNREKTSKKKNRDDYDLVNIEAKGMTMEDTGVETKEDGRQKKKRGKGEKSNKDTKNEIGLVNAEAKGMILEDNGVDTEEDDRKRRKREKRENEDKDNCLQDTNVNGEESAGKKNKIRKKQEKNMKLQCKQLVKEQESDLEFAFTKVEKNRKKENRKKVQKREGSCDGDCEAPGKKSDMGIEMNNESLSKDKKESNYDIELEVRKDKNKQKKEKKAKYGTEHGSAASLCEIQNFKEARENTETEKKDFSNGVEVEEGYTINGKEKETKERKKKKKEKQGGDLDSLSVNIFDEHSTKDKKRQKIASDEERNAKFHVEGGGKVDSENLKKRKKHKKSKHGVEGCSGETIEMQLDVDSMAVDDIRNSFSEVPSGSVGKKKRKRDREEGILNVEIEKMNKGKKGKSMKDVGGKGFDGGKISTKSKEECVNYSNLKPKRPSKRVKFSDKVEIFPSSNGRDAGKKSKDGLVRGKWFSREEDMILKNAVLNYVKEHDLGEDGVKKVLNSKSYPETKNCWKEICACMPWRPAKGIYYRAHILFERDEKRSWTPEELELVKKFHAEHGPKWKMLADGMDKSRIHVKDTWRRICLPNKKKGHWTQEEYQLFFDLVNMDLRMKVFEEKKGKHGMLRDNIAWEAISQKLSTRTDMDCCTKWYKQLESPLVREGKWASSDDFRLLDELVARDYSALDEVDWNDLLDHRPGEVCRKRWQQMVNHLGDRRNKAFADQVDVLRQRYCPDVFEARVDYENKVAVDADDI